LRVIEHLTRSGGYKFKVKTVTVHWDRGENGTPATLTRLRGPSRLAAK